MMADIREEHITRLMEEEWKAGYTILKEVIPGNGQEMNAYTEGDARCQTIQKIGS